MNGLDLMALAAPGSVLIDDLDMTNTSGSTYLFTEPQCIISAISASELEDALDAVSDLQSRGKYLAGYVSYDAGINLDTPLISRHLPSVPLLWFGVYDSVMKTDYADLGIHDYEEAELISDSCLNISDDEYLQSVARIKEYIAAGDVYQVNYTCKLLFKNAGTPQGLFARLRKAHPVCHSAFINTGEYQIMSLSPELFLRVTADRIQSRPMKGTMGRGHSYEEDIRLADTLHQDEKNRAENVMIVDLMRNDIGRVCEYGSVRVPKLFAIERYRSLLQMTSEVEGRLRGGMTSADILRATLPPGSITGAPKIRAMQIIDQLECNSRGVYCGCIGAFMPGGDMLLNVAIRSIVQRGDRCEMGIGSGIVADSDPHAELQETMLKGSFLRMEPIYFELLETMLHRKESSYVFLDEHLTRMHHSANFFGWAFDQSRIREALIRAEKRHIADGTDAYPARVRLTYSIRGEIAIEWTPLEDAMHRPVRLLLSCRRTDPGDVFLYHKTTRRKSYDDDLREAREAGFFDVLYMNTRNELTECAITNIIIEMNGIWYTPPISCGLLPGIWRDALLSEGKATERILTQSDLVSATRVIICNSVRGEMDVNAIESDDSGH